MSNYSPEQKLALEKRNIATLINTELDDQQYELLQACRKLRKLVAHRDKTYVVWKRDENGKAVVIDSLLVTDIQATADDGLEVVLESKEDCRTLRIGHIPVQILGLQIMANVPTLPDVRFTPLSPDYTYALQVHVLFRTVGDPDRHGHGVEFVSDVRSFVEYNPEFQNHRF
jgi:hypothetical protein